MIVVGGECLIDMVESEADGRGQAFMAYPGGSPFNVAMAAGRLGLPVQFLSRLSRDAFGETLERTLEGSRVGLALCPRTGQPSTLAIAGLDPETKAARYVFYTEGTAGVGLQVEELPEALPEEVEAIHVGSFSLTMEPIASALETLVVREAQRRVISIDPNIRSMLIEDAGEARARLERLLPHAHIVKMSDEDLAWLAPGRAEDDYLRQWIEAGVSLVVLTRGGDGAKAFSAAASCEVPSLETKVGDTIGAGDTFMAAMLAWLAEQDRLRAPALVGMDEGSLQSMLDFAMRAASVTVSRHGCDPPWRDELR